MGCRVSTPTKALPIIPKHKSLKHKSSLAVIAPQSQPGSPRTDHFEEKRMDAENSTGSLDSPRSAGNPDRVKTDGRSKSKSSSPSPMIKIVGIGGIGSSRIFSESSLKRSNSLDNSPNTGKHRKKDFTFHTGEISNATLSSDSLIAAKNMQLNRFLSINPKPSEFFVQKVLEEKKLSKLSTYAAPGSSTEDLKLPSLQYNIIRSLAESHEGGNSSHHETVPDTPGFKKHISSLGSQFGLEDTFHNQQQQQQQKKASRDFKSKRELEGDKMTVPELLAIPEGIFVDQDSDENPPMEKKQSMFHNIEGDSMMSERILNNPVNGQVSNRTRHVEPEKKEQKEREVVKKQQHLQPQQQQQQQQQQPQKEKVREPDEIAVSAIRAKSLGTVGMKQLSIQVLEGKEKQEDEEVVEGSLKKVREKKIISQPRFTRNLLDLVSVQSVQKSETSLKKRPSTKRNSGKHPLSGILEDLNHISATSSQLTSEERLKQIINDDLRDKGFQSQRSLRRESNRFTPLKFGNLEFLTNGEQVSPICNPKRHNDTSLSNGTFVLKSFIGSADFLEERSLSQISKIDFDAAEIKMTEVRETEMKETDVKVTDTHHSPEGEQPRRGISRKLVFENYLLGSQGLPSREEVGKFKSLPRSNGTFGQKFETHEEFVGNPNKGRDTSF